MPVVEYDIFRPDGHVQPSDEEVLADLATKQEAAARFDIRTPEEVLAEAIDDTHGEAILENQQRESVYVSRRKLGHIGALAYLHPEITNRQQAAEVQHAFDTRTESAATFVANMAAETIVARWEHSRREGVVRKMATFGMRLIGRAPAQESRYSNTDLNLLRQFANERFAYDQQAPPTRFA